MESAFGRVYYASLSTYKLHLAREDGISWRNPRSGQPGPGAVAFVLFSLNERARWLITPRASPPLCLASAAAGVLALTPRKVPPAAGPLLRSRTVVDVPFSSMTSPAGPVVIAGTRYAGGALTQRSWARAVVEYMQIEGLILPLRERLFTPGSVLIFGATESRTRACLCGSANARFPRGPLTA